MGRKQLDQIIRDFWHRDIDVLLCTTIVETGLDISNANTLIVDRADRFGLSQLHQLRGRVGRGRDRAYAYFLYDPSKPMTEQSHERLVTIAQNTALGSGFDVAMKDLELRGTGNLLGDEQSGHIEGVGFDLYVRMVSEAIEDYKDPERTEPVAVTIDLPIEASIPVDYIGSDKLRLEVYRKLAGARSEKDLNELRDELTDRYGKPPKVFESLFDVARLREKARALGISEIIGQGRKLRISKIDPAESVQLRISRIYPGAQYRPMLNAYTIPTPFEGSMGSGPMESDEVLRCARAAPRRSSVVCKACEVAAEGFGWVGPERGVVSSRCLHGGASLRRQHAPQRRLAQAPPIQTHRISPQTRARTDGVIREARRAVDVLMRRNQKAGCLCPLRCDRYGVPRGLCRFAARAHDPTDAGPRRCHV